MVRALGVSALDLSSFPVGRVNAMARYGRLAWAQTIENLEEKRKLATLSASDLMRTLQASKNALARTIANVGRIAKTFYLPHYIDDGSYRRRILIQLLRGEQRHRLARAVFYGRKGEVRPMPFSVPQISNLKKQLLKLRLDTCSPM